MNADRFIDWVEPLFPVIAEAANGRLPVLVLDNASYHNQYDNILPSTLSKKQEIVQYLQQEGVACHQAATKPQLLSILKDFYDSKGGKEKLRAYRVDKLAKEYGVEVLRLPPYHCMLNPIEKFWAYLKGQLRSTTSGEERLVELEEEAIGIIKRMPEEQQRNIFQNAKSVEDEFIAKEGLSFEPVLQDDEEEPPFSQFDEEYDSEDEYY